MCGIVGFVTVDTAKTAVDRERFLTNALMVDTVRGEDSTGVFTVDREFPDSEPWAYWVKQAVDGYTFVQGKEYTDMLPALNEVKYAVGHNRAATRGKVSTGNAHPFNEGPITLVHNGTIRSTHSLPTTMVESNKGRAKKKQVEVDSHLLCHNLASHDYKKVLAQTDGAYALVWHDARDDKLRIIRNSERPLHLVEDSVSKTVYFASEGEMLWFLLRRLKIYTKGSIVHPKPGQLLTFSPGVLLPAIEEVPMYTPKVYSYPSHSAYTNRGGYNEYSDTDWPHYAPKEDSSRPKGQSVTPMVEPKETHVLLGGKLRPIPSNQQRELSDLGLKAEYKLRFRPNKGSWSKDSGAYTVGGILPLWGGRRAMIYQVQASTYTEGMNRDWVVRPIGVRHQPDDHSVVICKLMRSTAPAPGEHVIEPDSMAKHDKGRTQHTYVPGPYRNYITAAHFDNLVEGGCSVCSADIYPSDAYKMAWELDDAGKFQPVCAVCKDTAAIAKGALDAGYDDVDDCDEFGQYWRYH